MVDYYYKVMNPSTFFFIYELGEPSVAVSL